MEKFKASSCFYPAALLVKKLLKYLNARKCKKLGALTLSHLVSYKKRVKVSYKCLNDNTEKLEGFPRKLATHKSRNCYKKLLVLKYPKI